MHIVEFLQQLSLNGPHDGPAATVRPGEPAFDRYFRRLFAEIGSHWNAAQYALACLTNFGVQQLSMRNTPNEGNQMFLQIGCVDGSDFGAAMVRSTSVKGHLLPLGCDQAGLAPSLDSLARPPTRFPRSLSLSPTYSHELVDEYLARTEPCLGFVALVCLGEPDHYLGALRATWARLHDHADLIVMASPVTLGRILKRDTATHVRSFPNQDAGLGLAVVQKRRVDYSKLLDAP
ncbi:MAG: hypothetical protein B7733_11380 [Myxococcales bacterium FL481]|nr:MAG: hypothetical protein B7733_11380 [Myxococcales bacterium FL481]